MNRTDEETYYKLTDMKKKLNSFFRELRKNGFFARQNFWCCQTCASSDIATNFKDKSNKFVYYHKQDTQGLEEDGNRVLIAFDGDSKLICEIARRNRLLTNWNGDKSTRIELIDIEGGLK